MSVRNEFAVVSLCSLAFFAASPITGTSAMAAAVEFTPISNSSFNSLTSVQVVPSLLAPLSSQSTGSTSVYSKVFAGAREWEDKYVYTYEITGNNIFAVSFDVVSTLTHFYMTESNNQFLQAPSRVLLEKRPGVVSSGPDTSMTVYFDGPNGLVGSSIFGFVGVPSPSLTGMDALAARPDTQRALVYTTPVPAALPFLVTALAGLLFVGRKHANSAPPKSASAGARGLPSPDSHGIGAQQI